MESQRNLEIPLNITVQRFKTTIEAKIDEVETKVR